LIFSFSPFPPFYSVWIFPFLETKHYSDRHRVLGKGV
jgi:hypothetical protein